MRSPSDYMDSKAYGRKVSLDWNVYKLGPGAERRAVQTLLEKVSPLRHYFKQTMFSL